jgi:hypothetical protein
MAALAQQLEPFVDGRSRKAGGGEFDCEALYEEIGRLIGGARLNRNIETK